MQLISKINFIIYNIQKLGGVEQHPLKAMSLPRVYSIVLVALEATATVYYTMRFIAYHVNCRKSQPYKIVASNVQDQTKKIFFIAKIIAGTISTIFFGIIFSPEINIILHQKLGLVVDNNINARKEKALQIKLELESKNEAVKRERAALLAQFHNERQIVKSDDGLEDDTIDVDLSILFLQQKTQNI